MAHAASSSAARTQALPWRESGETQACGAQAAEQVVAQVRRQPVGSGDACDAADDPRLLGGQRAERVRFVMRRGPELFSRVGDDEPRRNPHLIAVERMLPLKT